MPLTAKGEKILSSMKKEYGESKGERVFYASRNKGKISGVDAQHDMAASDFEQLKELLNEFFEEEEKEPEHKEDATETMFRQGAMACRDGKKATDNPHERGTRQFNDWNAGFTKEQSGSEQEQSKLHETLDKAVESMTLDDACAKMDGLLHDRVNLRIGASRVSEIEARR